jgi:hypothetical protein
MREAPHEHVNDPHGGLLAATVKAAAPMLACRACRLEGRQEAVAITVLARTRGADGRAPGRRRVHVRGEETGRGSERHPLEGKPVRVLGEVAS